MAKKRQLFHILNARARQAEYEKQDREEELYQAWSKDPRRKDTMERIKPLIKDDE